MLKKARRILSKLFHPAIGEIWQLHRVNNKANVSDEMKEYTISPEALDKTIVDYKHKGYKFISLDKCIDFIKGKRYPYKFVCITLDDGYRDNYVNAYPIFKKHHCPFTIFVATNYIFNETQRNINDGMLPIHLSTISSDSLCTIGAHTVSHSHLSEMQEEYVNNEIILSKRILETFLNKEVKYFAYPYGNYNTNIVQMTKAAGYGCAFAAWGGPIRKYVPYNLYELPRILK